MPHDVNTTTLQDLPETALWTRSGKSSNECFTNPYEKLLPAHTDMLMDLLACHRHFVSLYHTPRRPDPYDTSASYTTAAKRRRASVSQSEEYHLLASYDVRAHSHRRIKLNVTRLIPRYLSHTYLEFLF